MSAPICHYEFLFWGGKLLAPLDMCKASLHVILTSTNGCGREGVEGLLVPDTIWGLDISPVCRVHDWMYTNADTRQEEDYADAIFAANLVSWIKQKTGSRILQWLRLRRAYKYVDVVALTNCIDVATLDALGITNEMAGLC